jgi:signal transduction histidine kinase
MRNRIAADLHDDIGASLTQIVLLSEKMSRQSKIDEILSDPLSRIVNLARGTVDSLGDLVWAIDPDRERLLELSERVRSYAGEALEDTKIALAYNGPPSDQNCRLATVGRRHLYLVFKEGLNNTIRHSKATKVEISLQVVEKFVRLVIKDNGIGFSRDEVPRFGNGLRNMQHRTAEIGGKLEVVSAVGQGTTITAEVPLESSSRRTRSRDLATSHVVNYFRRHKRSWHFGPTIRKDSN